MAITYPVALPDDLFGQMAISENNTVGVNTSTFTGRTNKQVFSGEFWVATITFVRLDVSLVGQIEAHLSSLRGMQGECTIGDVLHSTPRGEARLVAGTPTVNGPGQAGYVLNVKEAPVSVTNYLLPGDRIQIGPSDRPRLHKILEPVDTSVAGTFSVTVWPILRNPIDDDPIFVLNPRGWFELTSNNLEYVADSPNIIDLRAQFKESNL